MLSAQSSRLIKELKRCSRRNGDPAEFAERCHAFVGDDDNLHAPEPRLDRGLTRVERHGDDKFPRRCREVARDFFEPACLEIDDAEVQLRRCVYNQHTLPLLLDLIEITKMLPQPCRTHSLDVARRAWRDWLRDDEDQALIHGPRRLSRLCDDTAHWETVTDAILTRSLLLREIVPKP